MSYSVINGYAPRSYDDIMLTAVQAVNAEFGTNYTPQSFAGTNIWKVIYAVVQEIMTTENDISTLAEKMKQFISVQNEELYAPTSTIDGFTDLLKRELNLVGSIKPNEAADAGNLYLCVDVDNGLEDYPTIKQEILDLMHGHLVGGLVYHGTEAGTVTGTNGQSYSYAYSLPVQVGLKVKVTIDVSDNTLLKIPTTNEVKALFLKNFAERYRLGFDFEPQNYLCRDDVPFAGSILIEYSQDNGTNWATAVLNLAYNEKVALADADVEVEIN